MNFTFDSFQVEVLTSDRPPIVSGIMHENDTYGEVNLISSTPHTVSLRAKTHCHIMLLSMCDLNEALACFPDVKATVHAAGERKFGRDKVLEGMKRVKSAMMSSRRMDD